jgi:hypothetical protein
VHFVCLIIIYVIFIKIIDNKKLKNDEIDNDMYIMHVNRYVIKTCSELGIQCDT